MTSYALPEYTRDVPPLSTVLASTASEPPTYSIQPYADEETVAMTPRAGATSSSGHFVRQWPQATLILRDQDPTSRLPTYGRGGRIIGELGLTNPDKIDRVTVKVSRYVWDFGYGACSAAFAFARMGLCVYIDAC